MATLRNLMESLVINTVEQVLPDSGACACERCKLDVTAIALNELGSRYVVTDRGESFAKADYLLMQRNVDILQAVCLAIRIVRENPRHGGQDEEA